jgi:RNA polymerase sigma-70 factor (family 1)
MTGEQDQKLQAGELDIITAIRARDRNTFELLYKKNYKQLFAIAYHYTGQAPAAEEIVHDVFLKLWQKAATLNIQYSLKSYLAKAIVNASLNFIKKENLQQQKQDHFLKVRQVDDHDELEKKELLLINLEKAMSVLPPKCREAMYLAYFGKLKQKDIALQMGISIKTVKNHLTYGFQKLRQHLTTQEQLFSGLVIMLLKYWGK